MAKAGDLAEVYSADGSLLGLAVLNPGHSITGHMVAFGNERLEEAFSHRIAKAFSLRKKWFDPAITNAYRLIGAEGDGIPGLIVDSYDGALVMQISHPGIERYKELIVSLLVSIAQPRSIFEKSTSFMRKKEGMEEVRSHLYGNTCSQIEVLENGLRYFVDLLEGQKTGFFLDQREMRLWVKQLSFGKKVLNCFAYTGGFSVSSLSGGANHVDSVESSGKCAAIADKNIAINHLESSRHRFIQSDVFDFLKTADWNYDLVILDPPAFVKKKDDIDRAFRAYKDMNAFAMQKMAPGSLLLTCSCSYHVQEELFQNILFRAALEAGRSIKILGRHRQAIDHPVSIFHPESSYLKSFLLAIES